MKPTPGQPPTTTTPQVQRVFPPVDEDLEEPETETRPDGGGPAGQGCDSDASHGSARPGKRWTPADTSRRASTEASGEPRSRRLSSFGLQRPTVLEFLRKHGSRLSLNRRLSEAFWGESAAPPPSAELRVLLRNRELSRNHLGKALSALYAKLLIILGVTLPVTELVSRQAPVNFHQGFYLYLYGVSIVLCALHHIARFRATHHLGSRRQRPSQQAPPAGSPSAHSGSFYLRIGAIAFGCGSLVYSALDFGQYFELNRNVVMALVPAGRMVLCVLQMQFIIGAARDAGLERHPNVARFGLMHLLATNVCEWLYVLVEEAKHEMGQPAGSTQHPARPINQTDEEYQRQLAVSGNGTLSGGYGSCRHSTIMRTVVQNTAPFLFPCTIEYSLICALTLFEIWQSLGRARSAPERGVTGRPANRLSVDCSRAQRGVLAGVVTLVLTFIALIMYFVLRREQHPELRELALLEVVLYEVALYAVTLGCVARAMVAMRDLKVVGSGRHRPLPLDCLLLLVTQTGIYVYGIFSIIGTCLVEGRRPTHHWAIVSEVLALAQTSLQTMFVLSSWWRRCKGARQNRIKPGRETVTFLLVANLAAWLVNSLVKSNASFRPLVMHFYGAGAWAIIAHVSMPLAIFYRFHSTICLFEIWKNSYKARYADSASGATP
ncbi:proton channel OtopLc-like [Anopheles bellator]|uniref:proton channel OtopLc-like n=1 Tax=Anopheles bellator TaxID=139047 RepID=UPI0026492004|nr:proton channel OtopLc-like [Anopheles bellator]